MNMKIYKPGANPKPRGVEYGDTIRWELLVPADFNNKTLRDSKGTRAFLIGKD